MYVKIILYALTQFSINEHVYNSKTPIAYKKNLTQFILKQILFWIVGQAVQKILF
jgi:hypothetical protein